MKKNILRIALVALVGVVMTACVGTEAPTFSQSDLLGLWQENDTKHYVRFTAEKADSAYMYAHEWDESEDVKEDDLKPYGNGWFKWKLVQTDLTEIHLMDNGGAEIPKIFTVTKLTGSELQYKDDYKKTHSYQKVVSVK